MQIARIAQHSPLYALLSALSLKHLHVHHMSTIDTLFYCIANVSSFNAQRLSSSSDSKGD